MIKVPSVKTFGPKRDKCPRCIYLNPSVIKVPSVITFGSKRDKGPICNELWFQLRKYQSCPRVSNISKTLFG